MKNMKKEFLIVVALLIATVFVISACNSSGEAIKKTETYEALDTKKVVTWDGLFDMFSGSCTLYLNHFNQTCNDECKSQGKSCIAGLRVEKTLTQNDSIVNMVQFDECSRFYAGPSSGHGGYQDCLCCNQP